MKSVVICGSKRFSTEIRKFSKDLKAAGVTVFEPYLHRGEEEWEQLSEQYKNFVLLGLVHDHFYKIKMADIVLIFNKGGYSGVSTTMEIGYAMALGKTIYALSVDKDERCRDVLFRKIIKTPKELIKILK
jgi:nucleoside 2-deoxyribosyltransferase